MESAAHFHDDVALFIDWENFKISLAAGHRNPNLSALKEEVANYGRVVVAKAYADWVTRAPELRGASQFTIDPPALYAAGIEPVYVPTRLPYSASPSDYGRTARVKNSVDVKMTADCIECAHSYANIGTYVLVSGDSDFIHVINALRTMGKRVIIIGISWSTSRRLADQVDGLILYDADVDPEPTAEPAPAPSHRSSSRNAGQGRQNLPDVIHTIEDIVRTERQAGRTPLLTSLKQRVVRRLPEFDEKKLGFSGFKKLMLRVAQEGNVKLVTVGLVDWVLLAEEPDPPEAHPEAAPAPALPTTEQDGPSSETVETAQPQPAANDQEGPGELPPIDNRRRQPADQEEKTEGSASEPHGLPELDPSALSGLELPEGPGDGLDHQRVRDLIIMADTLEHREGISHVAFNFLVTEVRQALQDAIAAENAEAVQHWTAMHSRTYVTRLLRSLGDGGVFQRGTHNDKDPETGRNRRRSTFNLNRDHGLVQQVAAALWQDQQPQSGQEAPDAAADLDALGAERQEPENGFLVETPDDQQQPDADGESAFGIGKVMKLFSRS